MIRAIAAVGAIAAAHLAAALAFGVAAFATQGDFDRPGPPTRLHQAVSSGANVLEFPLVSMVRRWSRERLTGFVPAALANSVLWGTVVYLGSAAIRRSRRGAT